MEEIKNNGDEHVDDGLTFETDTDKGFIITDARVVDFLCLWICHLKWLL